MTEAEKELDYIKMLREPFIKLCRLRFLNPDGSTAFSVGSSVGGSNGGAFIAEGNININLQNGKRRSASVTLWGLDDEFDYNVNQLWFGTEIALDEGLILSDGSEFYIQQGIFLPTAPTEELKSGQRAMKYSLVDKMAYLDGTLGGNLEGTYTVSAGVNIFSPISALLAEDRGNGLPTDRIAPVFTSYYNALTQVLPDGTTVPITNTPYDLEITDGSKWSVIEKLCEMLNAWVGYDSAGALRVDASQDDLPDAEKPVLWNFSTGETQLQGLTYNVKNEEVFNDVIVEGELLDNNFQPAARAQNLDASSDTNILKIGKKTIRIPGTGFSTVQQCRDLAEWKLKRMTVLQKSVTISCSQMFHLSENNLVTIIRTDKPGSPIEKHLIQSIARPLVGTNPMTISCTSVNDFAKATITEWPIE